MEDLDREQIAMPGGNANSASKARDLRTVAQTGRNRWRICSAASKYKQDAPCAQLRRPQQSLWSTKPLPTVFAEATPGSHP
jgi:hypothetical protein